jgi:hypothetical protein
VDDYGKLEFLGDAVLGLVVTTYIFYCLEADTNQRVSPEQLSSLRAAIVQNDTLAFVAVCKGLHRHMLHSSTFLQNVINTFVAVRISTTPLFFDTLHRGGYEGYCELINGIHFKS